MSTTRTGGYLTGNRIDASTLRLDQKLVPSYLHLQKVDILVRLPPLDSWDQIFLAILKSRIRLLIASD